MAKVETADKQDDGSVRIDPATLWEIKNTAAHHSRPGSTMTAKSLISEAWRLLKAEMRKNGQHVATYLNTKDRKPSKLES